MNLINKSAWGIARTAGIREKTRSGSGRSGARISEEP
jgi:hypothetical protein